MSFNYAHTACVYYISEDDESEVTVTTTTVKGDETLRDAALRVMKEDYLFDVDPDQLRVFMIHSIAWQWLKNIEWPTARYVDIDPEWKYSIEQCKLEVYKACRVQDAIRVEEDTDGE